MHNLLPTQARLFHLKMRNTPHPNCLLCNRAEPADLAHSLLTCPFNTEVPSWLMSVLHNHIPHLEPKQVALLHLPLVWLIINTLSLIWDDRREKKNLRLLRTSSCLEAKINILRKSRYSEAVQIIKKI